MGEHFIEEESDINGNTMGSLINHLYDKTIEGIPMSEDVKELAESYMNNGTSLEEQIDSLVYWQKIKCGTSGFITGLPGITTAFITIPANITSVLYIQIRMVAAIAYMCGHNLRDDHVKTMVLACLAGDAMKNIVQEAGVEITRKLSMNLIKEIPGHAIKAINKAVGFRLVTKFGEKGIINLGKCVPIIGGVFGAALDIATVDVIAKVAKDVFLDENL